MATTCVACAFLRLDPTAAPDVVVVGTLAYAWRARSSVEMLCRGLCALHEATFKGGVRAAESVAKWPKPGRGG
jgi:hypothetical protein